MLDCLSPARRRLVLGVARARAGRRRRGRRSPCGPTATRRSGRWRRRRRGRCCWCPGTAGTTGAGGAGRRAARAGPDGGGRRPARRRHRRPRRAGPGARQGRRSRDAARRAPGRSTWSATPPAAWSPGSGSRDHGGGGVARRVVTLGSPHHGTDLAALGGDARRPDSCPDGLPAARARQRPAAPAQRRRRDPGRPAVGLDLDRPTTRSSCRPTPARLDGALDFTVQSVCPGADVSHGDLPARPGRCIAAVTGAELGALGGARRTRPAGTIC